MNQNALWVSFDQHHFVLGMEWRLLQPAEKLLQSTLSQMRREGMQWYAASGLQDVVGMCTFGSPAVIARTRQLAVMRGAA